MSKERKYILNPEYVSSKKGRREAELTKDKLAAWGESVEDYFPGDYDKALPEEGAWIMLLTSVVVGKERPGMEAEIIKVPHLSIWFALPTLSQSARFEDYRAHKAVIQTPQGEVHIWPHEYTIVRDLGEYLDWSEKEGFYIHFLSESSDFDVEKLFYLQAKGVPKAQAQRLLLPELKDPHFCYFTFHEAYSEMFGEGFGMARPLGYRGRRRKVSA